MKLLSFKMGNLYRLGWLQEDGVTVLSPGKDVGNLPQSMMDVILGGQKAQNQIVGAQGGLQKFHVDEIEFLPPVSTDGIFCSAVNYYKTEDKLEADKRFDYPMLFTRLARNHVAHNAPLWSPSETNTLDWEGELVVIIGKGGRHITPENALNHIFGYAIYNEGTVRDFGSHSSQVGMSKHFQASGSFGPWVVTADEFGNPYDHRIKTLVDGEVMQDGAIDLMIHRIEDQIAYVSRGTELQPGDIFCTGTPSGMGVSMDPPRYLRSGETIEVSIDGIGTLRNPIASEPSNLNSPGG